MGGTGQQPQAHIRFYWAHFNLKLHLQRFLYGEYNAREDLNGKEYMEGDQSLEWIYH